MNSLDVIQQATTVFTNSADAYELCRNVVHGNFASANPTGANLLAIDQRGYLRSVASYGVEVAVPAELSLWDDHPVSRALQTKRFAIIQESGLALAVMPFIKNFAPVGGLLMNVKAEIDKSLVEEPTTGILAQLGAFYLDMNGLHVRQVVNGAQESSGDLTERQLSVLSMMALGQTNAEIARAMLLSESTIRQETVRIYRALGVNSRSEAAKKGKALGLISTRASTNPPV